MTTPPARSARPAVSTTFQALAKTVTRPSARGLLLASGVVAPVWWVGMDIVGSLRYPGYSYLNQTISELSAEGAPTRTLMVLSGIPFTVLMVAFGVGIWKTAGDRRVQRITGALLIAEAIWGGVGGLLFPMAIRGQETTLRNDMHAIYGIGMPILFLLAIGFGSRLFGKRFRYFSYGTILVLLVFGFLTALQAPQVPANEPTPWIGFEERVNAYVGMLWVAVLAIALLRADVERRRGMSGVSPDS